MPLHHRRKPGSATTEDRYDDDDDSIKQHSSSPMAMTMGGRSNGNRRTKSYSWMMIGFVQILLVGYASTKVKATRSTQQLLLVLGATWFASIPIVLSLAIGLGLFNYNDGQDLPHQRFIPLVVVFTIIGNQLPVFLSSGLAAIGIVIFGLSSRPIIESTTSTSKKNEDKKLSSNSKSKKPLFSGPLGAVLAVILMTTVLLTENFFIWVVSATFEPGRTIKNLPTPLQDNGQLVLRYLFNQILMLSKREVATLRNMINVEWILVSGLGLSFVAIEFQGAKLKRNLWSLALRALFTLTIARSIRTISFLITVLPSQNPNCYFSHFPFPPPADWIEWFKVGLIPQANGGCNDLIISGHATVTSTLACVTTSVVSKRVFTVALWMFVAMDYMVEIYEGFHYSVDMWLGAVLVNLIWTALEPVEKAGNDSDAQVGGDDNDHRKFYSIQDSTQSDIIKYALPTLGSYVTVNGWIPWNPNYTIVTYICFVASQIAQVGFQHYTQHILFSLLYMALGIYL